MTEVCLVLCGCGHFAVHCQMGEERSNLDVAERTRMDSRTTSMTVRGLEVDMTHMTPEGTGPAIYPSHKGIRELGSQPACYATCLSRYGIRWTNIMNS